MSSQRSNRESSAVPPSTSTPQATPKERLVKFLYLTISPKTVVYRSSTPREKPKGARPSPTRKASPNAPVTPFSTPPHITASLLDYGSMTPDQPVKSSALRKSSAAGVNKRPPSPASPHGPIAKRRKLDIEPHSSTTSIPATSITKQEQNVTGIDSAHSLTTDNVREAQPQPNWPPQLGPPSLQPGAGSSLSFRVDTNDYPIGVPDVITSTFNLEPISNGIDLVDTVNPNIQQLHDNLQRPLDELKRLESELRSSREETEHCRDDMRRAQDRYERFLKTLTEADVQKQSKIEELIKERDEIAKSFQSLKSQADRHPIKQREHTEVPQATIS
ncbi:MAG TPA: hypothetical protein VGO47_13275, partial [Chlamydiales bacterium]|nr:hypothetical protein [Chlamydiales bacterium]